MSGAAQMQNATPEQKQKGMEPWMTWFTKVSNAVVDGGTPFGETENVGPDHPKGEMHVSGYSIMQAESMEAVKGMLSDHPHLMMPKSCVEVLEMMPMQ